MLEILLVMVAVEHGEAEHAASDLLSLLLQLGQVLLGIICKESGQGEMSKRSTAGWQLLPLYTTHQACRQPHPLDQQGSFCNSLDSDETGQLALTGNMKNCLLSVLTSAAALPEAQGPLSPERTEECLSVYQGLQDCHPSEKRANRKSKDLREKIQGPLGKALQTQGESLLHN